MTAYKPGSFFLTTVSGPVGWLIGAGQALAGSPSRYEHGGIVLSDTGDVLEAQPGGAQLSNLSEYAGHPLLISDAPVQMRLTQMQSQFSGFLNDWGPTEQHIRGAVVQEASKLAGVPYSGLDYLALALLHLHLPSRWVRQRVDSSGHLICSALVDRVYANAGIHLFTDGRLPGDVMPSDLASWAEDHQGVQW